MDQTVSTQPKPFCFVLMPFSDEFRDAYELGIRAACREEGAHCERVDEQIHDGTILEQVYNQIAKADFIVAEMTGKNANVFYEVGYAHALGKRTVLLTRDANDIPFDLRHFPHIVYGGSISDLKARLAERVRWYVGNPVRAPEDDRVGIELCVDGKNLSAGNVECLVHEDGYPEVAITVYNASGRTYRADTFAVAAIVPVGYAARGGSPGDGARSPFDGRLPDGRVMHILASLPTFHAHSVYTTHLAVSHAATDRPGPKPVPLARDEQVCIVLRVLTEAGTRDYPLTLRAGLGPRLTTAGRILARKTSDMAKGPQPQPGQTGPTG